MCLKIVSVCKAIEIVSVYSRLQPRRSRPRRLRLMARGARNATGDRFMCRSHDARANSGSTSQRHRLLKSWTAYALHLTR